MSKEKSGCKGPPAAMAYAVLCRRALMNVGMYKGAASLAAYERWQESISQNIAASSIPGFKSDEVAFKGVETDKTRFGQGRAWAWKKKGSLHRCRPGFNFSQGELRQTGVDTDFAVSGPGFFQVQRENGEMGYTRDGEFRLSADRTLVTKQGFPVMGEPVRSCCDRARAR